MNDKKQFALCHFKYGFFRQHWICELGYTYEEAFRGTDKFDDTCMKYKILPSNKKEISKEINRCSLLEAKIEYINK